MTEITARLSTALADRYRIERHLGQGGMATVYLAEDLKHKRKVAVILALHSLASRFPDQTVREQLVDLVDTIPSGHDLPAFRAAIGPLSEPG